MGKKKSDVMDLAMALQNEHGWVLRDVPKSKRREFVFCDGVVTEVRIIQFGIPADSPLAKAMDEFSTPPVAKPKAGKVRK